MTTLDCSNCGERFVPSSMQRQRGHGCCSVRCRQAVTPPTRELAYEVVHDDPEAPPTKLKQRLLAQVLGDEELMAEALSWLCEFYLKGAVGAPPMKGRLAELALEIVRRERAPIDELGQRMAARVRGDDELMDEAMDDWSDLAIHAARRFIQFFPGPFWRDH